MAAADKENHVAYLEDADDGTGSCIEGTRKYATYETMTPPPRQAASTTRQRPNVGRLVTDPPPSSRRSPPSAARASFTESDSARSSTRGSDRSRGAREAERPQRDSRRPSKTRRQSQQSDPDRERRRQERTAQEGRDKETSRTRQDPAAQGAKEASNSRKARPAVLQQTVSQPVPQADQGRTAPDDAQRYAQQHPAAAAPQTRPRAQTRPASYYAGQPPYPVPMGWHHAPYPPQIYTGPPVGPPLGPLGPPLRYPAAGQSMGHMPPPSPMDPSGYYGGVPLSPVYPDPRQRYDLRVPSAMPPPPRPERSPAAYSADDFGNEDAPGIPRRPSRSQRREEDRARMPPPQRPMSAMPQSTQAFQPPHAPRPQVRQSTSRPPTAHRRSVGFADEYDYRNYDPSHDRFQDISPEPSFERRRYAEVPRHRRGSQAYQDKYEVIPASSRGRRASMYGTGALGPSGVSFEQEYTRAKYNDAMAYQNAISGGPPTPLTAETLRRANRVPSSRSTRSSGSRDESEHRRSYTTGITRSSSGNGNETIIKLDGAVLTVPNGAEITLSSRPSGSRQGSDRASTVYQLEDGRGRSDRMTLPHRSRAPSQSDSQGRGHLPTVYSQYEPAYPDGNYI